MTKLLYNPEKGADIVDYPIAEAQIGENGEPYWDSTKDNYRTTGRTSEWSLLKGQAAEFPNYVADVLKDRFSFLQVRSRVTKTVKGALVDKEPSIKDPTLLKCKECGQEFKKSMDLGMHMGGKHPELLL